MTNHIFDGSHSFPGIVLFSAKATSGQPSVSTWVFLYILIFGTINFSQEHYNFYLYTDSIISFKNKHRWYFWLLRQGTETDGLLEIFFLQKGGKSTMGKNSLLMIKMKV